MKKVVQNVVLSQVAGLVDQVTEYKESVQSANPTVKVSMNSILLDLIMTGLAKKPAKKPVAKKMKAVAVVDESEIMGQLILNDGSNFDVSQDYFNELAALYPAVNMPQEFNNIKGWLIANPTKRKTRTGIKRFINTWIAKQQDKGGKNVTANQSNADRAKTAAQSTLSSYDDFMGKNG